PSAVALIEAPTMADEITPTMIEALGRIAPAAGNAEDAMPPATGVDNEPLVDARGSVFPQSSVFARPSGAMPVEGRYLVLGSFRVPAYATRAMDRFAALAPRIAPAQIDGRKWHRVVIGPLAGLALAETRRAAAALGVNGAWPVTLCAYELGPRPCGTPVPRLVPSGSVQVAAAPTL
ncbi:MAG: SPOR domain-containing protein, partial [Alphaproteobacteria bacterium]